MSPASKDIESAVNGNSKLLDSKSRSLVEELLKLDQQHLFEKWPKPGEKDEEKKKLLEQLALLDSSYVGGLPTYITNAKKLLEDSRTGKNAFEGYKPSVPEGAKLDFGDAKFRKYEEEGIKASAHAGFVLVAGGLGERLGYSGIKVALPADSARGACFLQVYIESILALQAKAPKGTVLPLAIMTSGDTHERTEKLLTEAKYFGAETGQVTLLKQEKVACLTDSDAHLALDKDDPFTVQTKPHGHGDVHALLHSSGLLKKWQKGGTKWVCFFQDTNGLVFRALPAALGVSVEKDFDMNSLAVPRKAKEATGGITALKGEDGSTLTINVEYNLLDPLLKANGYEDGDVNDDTGFSPFPGNINQLVLKVDSYAKALEKNKGIIAEFVNPKYKDSSRTAFKSSTRLECMMQDFPRGLPGDAKVGFTTLNQVWAAYSPVKNSAADAVAKVKGGNPAASATTGEMDLYQANCRQLQMVGVKVDGPQTRTYNDVEVEQWPGVSWSPLFALTFADVEEKFAGKKKVSISKDSTLVINAPHVTFKVLELEGALVVNGLPDAHITIDGLHVSNGGWKWQPLNPDKPSTEEQAIRGFIVCKKSALTLDVDKAGSYTYPDPTKKAGTPSEGTVPTKELVAA